MIETILEKIGIIVGALVVSLWTGAEPTIGIFLKFGFSKLQIALVFAVSYMFTLNIFVWWPIVMKGKVSEWDERFKDQKWWVIVHSWSKKLEALFEVPTEETAKKESAGSFFFRAVTFFLMGVGHLYLPGNVLVMLEPWTWHKLVLGLALYLGALSRVIAALLIWKVLAGIGGWLPWAALGLFVLYIIYQKFKKKKIAI